MSLEKETRKEDVAATVRRVLRELHAKLQAEGRSGEFTKMYFTELPAYGKRLEEKYPDARRVRAYHALIGSTVSEGVGVDKDDFPGEDSVLKFLEDLRRRYLRESE